MPRAVNVAMGVFLIVFSVGFYLATRSDVTDGPVSESDAAAALADMYDVRSDADALCALGASVGNCRALLQGAGPPPPAEPRIVCSAAYEGDATHASGLIVRVHVPGGVVETVTLVIKTDEGVRFMNPVYWSGGGFNDEPVAEALGSSAGGGECG